MSVDGIVLVHGANHSAGCWDSVLTHLAAPAIAVDLPGRGSRPADLDAVTVDICVQAVIDTADQAEFDRFVLVGHSFGGVTITETAWRHPERVDALVYIGAIVPAPGESAAMAIGVDMPPGPRMPTEERAKMFFGNDMTDDQWADHWETLVPESATLWNSPMTGNPAGVPITYVSMADDVGCPPSIVQQMIANLGHDVDHRVLSAGHIVMVTKPRDLAEIINGVVHR